MAAIEFSSAPGMLNGDNGGGRTVLYDANGIPIARAVGALRGANDQFLPIGGVNDDNYRIARTDRIGGLAMALNTPLFSEPFEGATISTQRVTVLATTFTQAQSSSVGLNFNSGNVNTAAAAALLTTNRRFMKLQRAPLHFKARARLAHVANAVMELGFGNPASQTASPTVGAYWQVTTGGVVQPVLAFNGTDVPGAAVSMPGGWQNNYYVFDVILDDDEAIFFLQNTATGAIISEQRLQLPATQARLWDASRLSGFARLHNMTAPVTAATLLVSSLDVVLVDAQMGKPWGHTAAQMGLGGEVLPTTFLQSTNWGNSAAPALATLSNTVAGYTTLGGLFSFNAVAGAVTDYALFGFTVPAPYSFVCTGIEIDAWNTGAAVAGTPTLLAWALSTDQTVISLATASNRRIPLGAQSFVVGAAVGARADRAISVDLSSAPAVTNPGRLLVVALRMPVGTATASQVIAGLVALKGYFE